MTSSVLGVIAARGGSKGIPRKNIKLLAGKPLIAYAIEAALGSRLLTRCVVSTEDSEIASVARALGANVPFRRPDNLATDDAKQIDVLIHALLTIEKQEDRQYDIVAAIQPTAPLRQAADIDRAIDLLLTTQADSVISLVSASDHPYCMYTMANNRPKPFVNGLEPGTNRQSYPQVFIRNGAMYAMRRHVLVERRSLYGNDCRAIVMPSERSVNIDTQRDWRIAEFLLQESKHNGQAA